MLQSESSRCVQIEIVSELGRGLDYLSFYWGCFLLSCFISWGFGGHKDWVWLKTTWISRSIWRTHRWWQPGAWEKAHVCFFSLSLPNLLVFLPFKPYPLATWDWLASSHYVPSSSPQRPSTFLSINYWLFLEPELPSLPPLVYILYFSHLLGSFAALNQSLQINTASHSLLIMKLNSSQTLLDLSHLLVCGACVLHKYHMLSGISQMSMSCKLIVSKSVEIYVDNSLWGV